VVKAALVSTYLFLKSSSRRADGLANSCSKLLFCEQSDAMSVARQMGRSTETLGTTVTYCRNSRLAIVPDEDAWKVATAIARAGRVGETTGSNVFALPVVELHGSELKLTPLPARINGTDADRCVAC